ncbi:MAG: M42 family metallopeptidase [Clostridiales bacterium]|nr:M42 family metallopeptidase [Clostridiales bacterium]
MFDMIKKLVDAYGPTGRETLVADTIEEMVKPCVDTIRRDAMGNLICEKQGMEGGKRIMLSAHMDHIGFIVVAVEKEGFLRVMPVGGIGMNASLTRHVTFGNGVQGIIAREPVREGETPAMKHMFIDIGAENEAEALSMVNLGDMAVYSNDCFRLGENKVAAPAMDDRIACALLVAVLKELPEKTRNTIIAVFSTQEEVGCRGAKTAAYGVEPDIGIALDVTANGDTPETKLPAVKLGAGAAIKVMDRGSISNPELFSDLLAAGKAAGVPTQREVLPFGGTDASAIQLSRGGVKVCTVSIPCRYVHSACEVIDLRDVDAAKKLLVEYLK